MVSVDTSRGGETGLLEPIAARYRSAGVPAQILESAPGRGNLIARLKGNGKKRPLLLLAHVDVVPVDGQTWTVPPFAVTEKDGFLWGRGVNDDKGMAAAIVAVSLELARTAAPLTRDIIVALTSGEETGGSAGVRWLTENHPDLIEAAIALNEGGATLLRDDFSKAVVVSVGVSEKTFQTFRLVTHGKGGHSSLPPTNGDPVVALARALVKLGDHRFSARVLPEVAASFNAQLASAEPAYLEALRHAIRTAPRLAPVDEAVLSRDAAYNAEVRTTCVTTMLKGAAQDNVLPTTAEATVNCRILPGDTLEAVRAELVATIGDPAVEVVLGPALGESAGSPFEGEVVAAIRKAASDTFPGTPVVPAMGTGATDSRHLRRIGILAYGVSPTVYTRAEALGAHVAHGPDERTSLQWLRPMTDYFREIVRTLAL
jgi:acetylornithine deacetylase/succinyl-diaminopimelate desuccinylase-like protein